MPSKIGTESKGRFKARLMEEGRWTEFCALREQFKAAGRTVDEAWLEAAGRGFMPDAEVARTVSNLTRAGGLNEPIASPRANDLIVSKRASEPITPSATESIVAAEPKAPSPDQAADESLDLAIDAGSIPGISANKRLVIEWVAANVVVVNVDIATAPCTEALGLLRWVRSSRMNEGQFWTQIYRNLLPSRAMLDDEQKRSTDDERNNLEILAAIEAGAGYRPAAVLSASA